MRISYLITAIVVGLLVILALQYRDVWLTGWGPFGSKPPAIEPSVSLQPPAAARLSEAVPERVAPVPEPEEPVEPAEPIPPLSDSDDYVRGRLSAFTAPEEWLGQTELARRLAVLLTSTAAGTLPRGQLGFLLPEAGFPVQPVGDDGKAFILDPAGYERFAATVDALLSVEPNTMAAVFLATEPLLDSAVVELGEGQGVRTLLNQALNQLLTTPVLEQSVVLKRPEALYEFADPELEALSDLQKQLLRMGPNSVQRLQEYAQAVVDALQGPQEEALPDAGQAPADP